MPSSSNQLLYLSQRNLEELGLGVSEIITTVEQSFMEKGRGEAEMPPKPGIHPTTDAFIHAMPAYLPKMRIAGMKWISGFPENFKRGLPYIAGLLILNDPDTGLPIAVIDGAWITAKRTGAVTAVAAKYLARKDSKILGVLGCGVEGRSNLEALHEMVKSLEEIRAYDISSTALQRYVDEITVKFGLRVEPVQSPRYAVEGADIVVTAGPILKNPQPTIESSWIKDGILACPIDWDSYWKPDSMHSMHKFCTDDTQQLLYYQSTGYFRNVPNVYADLGQIVLGQKPGRESDQERIMSMNLGLAIADLAVGITVYERAKKANIGQWLPL